MIRVPVHYRGEVVAETLIDDKDAELAGSRWRLSSDGYAVRTVPGRQRHERMHRAIMGAGPTDQVDHRNLNRLDNRRSNLRILTGGLAQQLQNVSSHRDARSQYRGVCFHRASGKWQAEVCVGGERFYGGLHDDELDAAWAAEELRREHMPFHEPVEIR